MPQNIRNVAIIAHVDHGKTTLVDGLLKQSHTFRENQAEMNQEQIMDTGDLERERGITILAKNTAIQYKDTKINIVDTPGHADFGGEVERTMNMADGAILVVDAQEGPMPQTKFVLRKAFEAGLRVIVVVNKIDKPLARTEEVVDEISSLFLDLATDSNQLDFPTYYAIGRAGKAWEEVPFDIEEEADLTPIFEAIVEHVPAPEGSINGPFQMQVTTLDSDAYQGIYAIGRILRGKIKPGENILRLHEEKSESVKVSTVFTSVGLSRVPVETGEVGDIVAVNKIGRKPSKALVVIKYSRRVVPRWSGWRLRISALRLPN